MVSCFPLFPACKHPEVGNPFKANRSRRYTKKAQVFCFLAYPGVKGLRIAHLTQDRQRSQAHASTNYI